VATLRGYLSLSFVEWWRRPIRTRDRVGAFFVGAFGGFWVGLLGRVFLGAMPVGFTVLAYWALGTAIAGALLGVLMPRVVTVLLYPFSTFGVGSS
jgi:hypothetical protein